MWVSSISPQNLSLIGPLTMEIYYQTGITGKTIIHTETESDPLPIKDIGLSNKGLEDRIELQIRHHWSIASADTYLSPALKTFMMASLSFCGMSPCMDDTVKFASLIFSVNQST